MQRIALPSLQDLHVLVLISQFDVPLQATLILSVFFCNAAAHAESWSRHEEIESHVGMGGMGALAACAASPDA